MPFFGNGEAKPVFAKDDEGEERSSLLWLGQRAGSAEKKVKLVKALFYAVQVFYSFFIMWVVSLFPLQLDFCRLAGD